MGAKKKERTSQDMPGILLLHDEQTQTGQVRVMTKTRVGFYETTQQNKKKQACIHYISKVWGQ